MSGQSQIQATVSPGKCSCIRWERDWVGLRICLETLSIYLSGFFNSCRCLPETKRRSSLFLHWSGSKFLVVMAACTPFKLLVSHRDPPQVADRGTLTRYGGYRGNKYAGCTKTSTALRQFDIDLSRARGRKLWPKITWSFRLAVDAAGHLLAHN